MWLMEFKLAACGVGVGEGLPFPFAFPKRPWQPDKSITPANEQLRNSAFIRLN
jgi:hypothetical protein